MMLRASRGALGRAGPRGQLTKPPALFRQHHHHHSHSHQSSSNSRPSSFRPSFILPILFTSTSPLLLESSDPPPKATLSAIKQSITRPDAAEFLSTKPDKPPSLLRTILDYLDRYLIEPLSTARRFVYLALVFLPVIATSPILLLEAVGKKHGHEDERATTRWWYGFLVGQMARAGPTFIKLAQWAGSRTDLFPPALCDLFGQLHSKGKPHSFAHTQRVIEAAFSQPFASVFLDFPIKPMGVGAIAQVYKAVLNPNLLPSDYLDPKHTDDPSPVSRISKIVVPTEDDKAPPKVPSAVVAIKVLHPGVEKMISRDLKIMLFFARALNALPGMEWLSFPEEVTVFGEMMMSQIDLRIEANNLGEFEDNFKHRPTISFPRALKEYTSKHVLTEDFEDALPLETFLGIGAGPFNKRIANLGLDAFLNMLLVDNYCHADLHPGNIMIKFYKPTTRSMLSSLWAGWFDLPERDAASVPSNTEGLTIIHHLRSLSHKPSEWLAELDRLDEEGYQPEIVFIDTGLVTALNPKNRRDFLDLFSAVAQFDGYRAGRLMVERCRAPELVIDAETFALRIQKLVLGVKSQTFSLAKIKIADVLSEVLWSVRQHHVKLEADFVNTVLSILLLEGIGRQLDPDMDLFKSALPIMRNLGRHMRPQDVMDSGLDVRGLGALLKIWVWIEARQLAELATDDVDDMLRYDRLTPNV
ncbi:hypothetical protein MNV49_002533 [Pseudohyphozyma bogoriensis]|nr:hypothetical protein MNV49_002533 [Pseudohyphozyma bogoriensis]